MPDESRQDGSPPCDLLAVPPRYLVLRAPGSRTLTLACLGSFHLDFHAHPRMDAALKKMFTFRETRDLALAALKDSGLGHGDIRKAAGTFGNRGLSSIKVVYEAATELRHLGEGVRLAALVEYVKSGSFLDVEGVRFEVPAGVRSSRGCLRKQVGQFRACSKRDVPAEIRPQRGIEGDRIAFVQGHHLCETWWIFFLRPSGKQQTACEHQTACE